MNSWRRQGGSQRQTGPILETRVSKEENRIVISVAIPATTFSFFEWYLGLKKLTIQEYVDETALDELRSIVDTMPKDELLRRLGLTP